MYKQNWNTFTLKSKTDEAKEVKRKYDEMIAKKEKK
jgi:hypothetical protein